MDDLRTLDLPPLPAERAAAVDAAIRELYVERRYSDREIADAIGLHRVTVTKRRLAMGVTRADRVVAVRRGAAS